MFNEQGKQTIIRNFDTHWVLPYFWPIAKLCYAQLMTIIHINYTATSNQPVGFAILLRYPASLGWTSNITLINTLSF